MGTLALLPPTRPETLRHHLPRREPQTTLWGCTYFPVRATPYCVMPAFIDLTGQKFGRLTVVKRAEKKRKLVYWLCQCECGVLKEVLAFNVRSGHTQSCGCLHKESVTTHGNAPRGNHSPEYGIWSGMLTRAAEGKPPSKDHDRYRGRGITVCDRWQDSFEAFLMDMGPRPSRNHSLDRIDNDGNYCPENCRWATRKEQSRNTRTNKMLVYRGETRCLAEWVEITGVPRVTIRTRLRLGWTVEQAFETPIRKR